MDAQARQPLIKFLLTGGAATGLQYLLLIALVEWANLAQTPSSAMAFAVSAIFNYLSNYYFTFSHINKPHSETLYKFIVVASLGLLMNTLAFWLGVRILPHYLLAQCVATGITLMVNFLLHKYWIYSDEPKHEHNKTT